MGSCQRIIHGQSNNKGLQASYLSWSHLKTLYDHNFYPWDKTGIEECLPANAFPLDLKCICWLTGWPADLSKVIALCLHSHPQSMQSFIQLHNLYLHMIKYLKLSQVLPQEVLLLTHTRRLFRNVHASKWSDWACTVTIPHKSIVSVIFLPLFYIIKHWNLIWKKCPYLCMEVI